jgi:hypothetical protein
MYVSGNVVLPVVLCECENLASGFNPSTPNDLERRRALSPFKIKIPSKNMREKSTYTPIINSVY